MENIEDIKLVEDIKSGQLPGFIFEKLLELGDLQIKPFQKESLGNICYYLHLNNKIRRLKNNNTTVDLQDHDSIEAALDDYIEVGEITLNPGESIIAQTFEEIGISEWLLAKLENTSSLGRVFVNHASHGFCHPGHGKDAPIRIMLELTNLSNRKIILHPAKIINGEVVGTEIMRLYLEKLPYKTLPYNKKSSNYKVKMDKTDLS